MRVAALAFVLVGCGAGIESATVLPAMAPDLASAKAGTSAERWVAVPARSRIDVVGVDVMGGKHPVTFDRWTGVVTIGPPNRVVVDIQMASARGESEMITRILKYDLLEVDRYPTATLSGTIDDKGLVEGNAAIHGVEKGLRFHGTLTREGEEYRFVARFKISRDVFKIHSDASWDGLVKDDVHIYADIRARHQ